MTDTNWPTDEDVRKALNAWEDAPNSAFGDECMRAALLAGTEALTQSQAATLAEQAAEIERLKKAVSVEHRISAETWKTLDAARVAAESALATAIARVEKLEAVIGWVESFIANSVSGYSVAALDGIFAMTRDKIAALEDKPHD